MRGPDPARPPAAAYGGRGPDLAGRLGGSVAARWFQALYETPLLFSGILDSAGRVLDANQLAIEGCGFDRAATLGRPFWECGWWAPDAELSDRLRGWCATAMRTGEPFRTYSHFFVADGARRMVDLALFPVHEDGGGYLVATGLDVTDALATQRKREERAAVETTVLRQAAMAREREIGVMERAERRADERLDRLVVVALELLGAETLADLTSIVVDRAVPVLGADGGAVVVREGEDRLRVAVSGRLGPEAQAAYADLPYDSPLPACFAARTGERVLLPDRAAGLAFTPAMAQVYAITRRDAWAFLPLRVDGRLLGSLAVSWLHEREFRPDEITMLEAFAAQCAQALDRIRDLGARREGALAAQRLSESLQRSLLTQPPTGGRLEIAVRYQPAAHGAHVGGDWYDAFETTTGDTVLVIGDVAGHDRVAVAGMGQIRNLLRGLAYDSGDGPALLLGRLDRALRGLRVGALATAVLARVGDAPGEVPGSRRLRWSNAGHPPALLRAPDGEVRMLAEHNLLLGVNPSVGRTEHGVDLVAGATLVLYTDGLVERRDGVLDEGIAELAGALARFGDRPPEELCDLLLAVAPAGHEDDIALLVMRYGAA